MQKKWEELFKLREKSDLKFIKNELERINFKKRFKIVNVVGTNGKGSCSKMIAKTLEEKGYRVGLFTSPHIVNPNERISINGKEISDYDFFSISDKINKNQFFSSLYIVAMKYFQNNKVDFAILEAGVGGKLDATNTIPGDFGLLTSIGLDHVEYLGNTHQKIFDDKIQIKNEGMSFYIPSHLPANIKVPNELKILNNESSNYQTRNQLLVFEFFKDAFNINKISKEILPCRSELKYLNGVECVFDVAHNYSGIKESLKYLKDNNIEYKEVVISLAKRKDVKGILELFGDRKIRYFKPDSSFREFNLEKIENIKEYKPNCKTLFIGSFRLIGKIYE